MEWALELSSFGLKFEITSTVKSRALAEWTATPDEEIQETTLPGKAESEQMGKVGQKKKVVQTPFILLVPSCRGLDQDIMVYRSYF